MTRDDAEALVERYITEVLVGEEYDAIDELFVASFDEPKPTIVGGLAASLEDIKASYEEFHEHVSISDVDILTVHATETEALAVWSGKTRYHDTFRGIQPAGKPKLHRELTWVEITDGRIDHVHHLRDSLETIPPAARVAHTSALSTIETGVVAVDKAGDVVHANPAALDIVESDRDEVLGTPVRDLLGESVSVLYPGESTELTVDNGQRVFEVIASSLRDERYGVTVGRFLLLHDVTERKRRIQRLQVLNRVLRHNLRNDLTVIVGRAEFVRETLDGLPERIADALDVIVEVGQELIGISEQAREVETALSPKRRAIVEQDLASLARSVAVRAREDYASVAVEYEGPEEAPVEAAAALQAGLWALVENACEHNDADDPRVVVTVERRADAGVVTVADNGPGVPDHERAVIAAGEETPLEHGSGLGLWLVRWVVETSGGGLSFDENEPRGSVVTVEVPAAAGDDSGD